MDNSKTHDTNQLFRLTETSYNGISFPAPPQVWTRGEIKLSLKFRFPYKLEDTGKRMTINTRDGESQKWELAL